MVFDNAENTKKQGDIGESRAIYEYTRLGWVVCKPLCDSAKYDLIIERDGILKRVQVKTSHLKSSGVCEVGLRTTGGNQSFHTVRNREENDYDELFVLINTGDCWIVPSDKLGINSITITSSKFSEYKI